MGYSYPVLNPQNFNFQISENACSLSEGAELVPYMGVRVGVCQRFWSEGWLQ